VGITEENQKTEGWKRIMRRWPPRLSGLGEAQPHPAQPCRQKNGRSRLAAPAFPENKNSKSVHRRSQPSPPEPESWEHAEPLRGEHSPAPADKPSPESLKC